jgi:hypothetical protein
VYHVKIVSLYVETPNVVFVIILKSIYSYFKAIGLLF